jgi:cell division control protein 24
MNGHKKSIASSGPNGGLPQIDTGVVNTLLRKPGSSAAPLYQQCSALGARLARIHDFAPFLTISSRAEASSRQSVDPVHALWDCLALGTPLCFLFNLLDIPSEYRLDVSCDPDDIDPDDLKARKRATAKFIMGINRLQEPREDSGPKFWEGNDTFTVGDLVQTDRNTNGFVKVCAYSISPLEFL